MLVIEFILLEAGLGPEMIVNAQLLHGQPDGRIGSFSQHPLLLEQKVEVLRSMYASWADDSDPSDEISC